MLVKHEGITWNTASRDQQDALRLAVLMTAKTRMPWVVAQKLNGTWVAVPEVNNDARGQCVMTPETME